MKKEYRNSLRTKKMIRAAFVDLVDERKLLSSITVSELAERADIAKSTFYNHYDDIYAVADEMFNEMVYGINAILDSMDVGEAKDYHVYIKTIFNFLKENEEVYRKLVNSPDAIIFADRVKMIIKKRIFANVKSPFLSKNKNERALQISFVANACIDVIIDYFKGQIDMPFDDFEKAIMNILDKMV